jgi:hypothetical protein
MRILVSDTSVLIDLERGELLDSCFKLPFEFAVPDLLYARELADYGGPALVERGLRVEGLTGEEVTLAQEVRGTHPKLSLPDAFAYSLASARGWTLLTGDGELRALAQAQQISFFGVLWVLDQLFDSQVIEPPAIVAGLEAIAAHPRCRLPRAEIQARLERYGKVKT